MTNEEIIARLDGIDLAPAIAQSITKTWGKKCPDYEPCCAVCAAWHLFEKTGERPTFKEVCRETESHQPQPKETS